MVENYALVRVDDPDAETEAIVNAVQSSASP